MKQYYFMFSFIWSAFLTAPVCLAQRMQYHRINVEINPERLEYLFNHGLEIDHFSYENKKSFTAEVSDADVKLFQRNGIKVTYLIKDLEKNFQKINAQIDREMALKGSSARAAAAVTTPTNFSLGSFAGYYSFAELPALLDKMRTLYPNLISAKTVIGTSPEGRPLYMVRISDNPDVDENEPELLLNALHHAREPISLSQLVFFMWHVLENYGKDKEIRTLLNSSEMYIVPCVNPDGYVYNQTTNPNGGGMWRKNRKANAGGTYGVDLNRNYSYNYALDNTGSSPTTSSDTYRGTGAFSETETAAIRNLAAQHQFVTAFNFHSYSNVCIYPFESLNPNNNAELSKFSSAATYLTAENGFAIGNAYQTVGYKANGTAPDWEFGEQVAKSKIYGFTPEIGSSTDGFWPASSRIVPLCNTMIEMNRKLLRISTYYARATARGTSLVNTQASSLRYQFQNFGIKPASFSVTATALSSSIASVGPAKTYTGLAMLQSVPDSIAFTVAANTPSGTQLPFEVAVDNGMSVIKDTITLTYTTDCGTPTGLATTNLLESSATINWGAISGSSSYMIAYKPKNSANWSADISVSGTSYGLTGLTIATAYDWRVKASCGTTAATASFTTTAQTCFQETGGTVTFEAENYRASTVGTGAAAGRSWSSLTLTGASGGKVMTITGTDVNVQNSLVGPRLDYALNFTTTGTYYVWVRMAAGPDGIYDDSFHIGLDGATPVTLNPNTSNYNNGSQSLGWIKAAGTTAFKVVVNTPGAHTLNLWMREDGVRVDKFVLTTNASYTPTGTGPATSGSCVPLMNTRLAASEPATEPTEALRVVAYPNPFEQSITIKVNGAEQEGNVRLLDINGRTHQQVVVPATETERTLQIGGLPTGAYFIEVIRGDQRKVVPIRKQ